VRNHLLERMRAAAILHIEMAWDLAALWAVVTSSMELVLGHSPDETFWVEIMDELVAQFRKLEEMRSWLERPDARTCDLHLSLPPDQAQHADRLDEATRRLEAELTAQWQVGTELEALRTSAARVQDLVLDNIDGASSLGASLSIMAELLEVLNDATTANRVRRGTRSVLVATLSHFLELKCELELLGFGRNEDLIEDHADAASDSLASLVPSSVARDPPDGTGE
jgi:hypothetical protein